MGRFTGVLLATDYDDTLYDRHYTISRENREAIDGFLREGGLFTVSTGRSLRNFSIQMERERLPLNAPAILTNGAVIHDFSTGETLRETALPAAAAEVLAQVCAAFPDVGFEAYRGEDVYTFRANAATQWHLAHCSLTGLPRESIQEMPGPWLKVILQHEEPARLEEVRDWMLPRWGGTYEIGFSNPYLLEVTAGGADKGGGVLWVARRLGVKPEDIYCVGNGMNDLAMLKVSAVPFAPADCYRELKDWGAVILPPCNENTVAALIRALEDRYPAGE